MDEVTIGGVTYLPATKLAKQYRYTTDYIGQLCRSKKVDAQLVGRSWYVNPDSLLAHKSGRYAKAVKTKASENESSAEVVKVKVEPVLKKATVKGLKQVGAENPHNNFAKRIDWKPVKYEIDETELLPSLRRPAPAVALPVDLADATDITIKSAVNLTNLVPEPLPEVSLKGSLKVVSLNEYFDTKPETVISMSEEVVPEPAVALVEAKPIVNEHQQSARRQMARDFTPKQIHAQAISIETTEDIASSWSVLTITTTTVAVLVCLLATATLVHKVDATSDSYAAGIGFSVEDLEEVRLSF